MPKKWQECGFEPATLNIERLKEEIAKHNYTLAQVSEMTGMAPTTISRRLNGHLRGLSGDTLARFGRAFNIEYGELVK